ncbi:Complex III subunit 9 [Cladobotryum mycophilum]|uniref:Complex III subunit 9 n=1 Tax=Cladobotryum mycophilum TaxID=491253 RepID=A0ABR0S594_9HYPO
MSLANTFYNALFKRNFAMLGVVFGAGFAFEVGFNNGMNRVWDNLNRGRQWKDIRHKYIEGAEEEEDDD